MIDATNIPSTNFFNSDALDTAKSEHAQALHPKEAGIQKIFGKNALTLDPADPRPKMLYLMAAADELKSFPISSIYRSIQDMIDLEETTLNHSPNMEKADFILLKNLQNQALKGDKEAILALKHIELVVNSSDRGIDRFFQKLNKDFDVRFKIIHSTDELCQEIADVSKVDNFKSLIIHGHGDPNGIRISASEFLSQSDFLPGKLLSQTGSNINYILDDTCFSNIPKGAEISLISCTTGKSEKGIASTISKLSKSHVYAPQSTIQTAGVEFSSDIPPIPTFIHKSQDGSRTITTCKFSPDGSRDCVSSDYLSLTMMALASLVAVYCGYKFFKSRMV